VTVNASNYELVGWLETIHRTVGDGKVTVATTSIECMLEYVVSLSARRYVQVGRGSFETFQSQLLENNRGDEILSQVGPSDEDVRHNPVAMLNLQHPLPLC
jgi:hypothetical protein